MKTIPVRIQKRMSRRQIESAVENACDSLNLVRTSKNTLATYAGSIHWHYKMAHRTGTLEVTYWPVRNDLWLKVHDRRTAEWMRKMLPALTDALARRLT